MKAKQIFLACYHALTEIFLFAPVVALFYGYLLNTHPGFAVIELLLIYMMGYFISLSGKADRKFQELLGSVLVAGVISVIFQGWNWHCWVSWAAGIYLALRGMRFNRVDWKLIFPVPVFIVGFILYLIVPIILRYADRGPDYHWFFTVFGVFSLIIFFFHISGELLKAAPKHINGRTRLPRSVLVNNRIGIAVFLVFIVGLGFVGIIRQGLSWVGDQFRILLAALISFLSRGKEPKPPVPPQTPGQTSKPKLPPAEDPAAWAVLTEQILRYVLVIVASVLVLVLLYYFVRRWAPFLVKKLLMFLNSMGMTREKAEVGVGYSDEKERLKSLTDMLGSLQDQLPRFKQRKVKWVDLQNNRERVRFLYRKAMENAIRKGYHFQRNLTPLETEKDLSSRDSGKNLLIQADTELYNKARYGNKEISDADLDKVMRNTRKS
ncbi:MAG TPA: hypothetical protein VFT51_09930 [Bacillales bacterium]|nr:hypothetical protein [Bacillales bacterium]